MNKMYFNCYELKYLRGEKIFFAIIMLQRVSKLHLISFYKWTSLELNHITSSTLLDCRLEQVRSRNYFVESITLARSSRMAMMVSVLCIPDHCGHRVVEGVQSICPHLPLHQSVPVYQMKNNWKWKHLLSKAHTGPQPWPLISSEFNKFSLIIITSNISETLLKIRKST